MARTTVITDDLDGSHDANTYTFGLEGVSYEIDLSEKNAEKLRGALAPFIDGARRVGGSSARKTAQKSSQGPVRTWAAANGFQLNPKGRVPKHVLEAYDKAHS